MDNKHRDHVQAPIRQDNYTIVENALRKVIDFLKPYLPLANAHNTDFILWGLWNVYVNPHIASELLTLSHKDIYTLLNPNHVNVESEDLTSGHHLHADGMNGSHIHSETSSHTNVKSGVKLSNETLSMTWHHKTLAVFRMACQHHHLDHLGVLSDVSNIIDERFSKESQDVTFVRRFMSEKKSHEVEVMSDLCHQLAKTFFLSNVIDIGSGKGYLSAYLSLGYKYNVLGIDACQKNTRGADDRNRKLTKQWCGIVHHAEQQQKVFEQDDTHRYTRREDVKITSKKKMRQEKKAQNTSDVCDVSMIKSKSYVPLTMFINSSTDLDELISTHIGLDQNSEFSNRKQCMLAGLHTCGNLASNMLKIFQSQSCCKVLCNVGCCYHHLQEEFIKNPFLQNDEQDSKDDGFPMSHYLKDEKFCLGRNARMLACQSADRLFTNEQDQSLSLHWRAVLQILLYDVTGEQRKNWNVGRIASRCHSFLDYVRKALSKLGLEHIELSDDDILQYEMRHAEQQFKMFAFYHLRALLAPCIEGVIMLDRCLYLLEQEAIAKVHLMKLFDPVVSPRCYAIVAVKEAVDSP